MAMASPTAVAALPRLGLNGYQASLGYALSASIADQHRLAASELWPQQRRVLQWRAAAEAWMRYSCISILHTIRAVTPIAAMP